MKELNYSLRKHNTFGLDTRQMYLSLPNRRKRL
jgi:hypothetical protein